MHISTFLIDSAVNLNTVEYTLSAVINTTQDRYTTVSFNTLVEAEDRIYGYINNIGLISFTLTVSYFFEGFLITQKIY